MPTQVVLGDIKGVGPGSFRLEQIRPIDKRRIRRFLGKLSGKQMDRIDNSLRVALHLSEDDFLPLEVEAS